MEDRKTFHILVVQQVEKHPDNHSSILIIPIKFDTFDDVVKYFSQHYKDNDHYRYWWYSEEFEE